MAGRNTDDWGLSTSQARSAKPAAASGRKGEGRAICVFCGSSPGGRPAYGEAARALGRAIGMEGYTLVFGGGEVGLMGEVARSARDAGARIVGVLPAFLRDLEPPLGSADELIVTSDLQQRKARMLALADAFVILPGGLGTLDEYFEVITTAQLRVHAKPVVAIDVEEYFAPLRQLLGHIVREGFARAGIASHHAFAASPAEALETIAGLLRLRPS